VGSKSVDLDDNMDLPLALGIKNNKEEKTEREGKRNN